MLILRNSCILRLVFRGKKNNSKNKNIDVYISCSRQFQIYELIYIYIVKKIAQKHVFSHSMREIQSNFYNTIVRKSILFLTQQQYIYKQCILAIDDK